MKNQNFLISYLILGMLAMLRSVGSLIAENVKLLQVDLTLTPFAQRMRLRFAQLERYACSVAADDALRVGNTHRMIEYSSRAALIDASLRKP